MSDSGKRIIGLLLLFSAFAILPAGLLPVRNPIAYEFTGENTENTLLRAIPHLSETDILNSGEGNGLSFLPGVGETISVLIAEERETNGRFWYPEDITAVRGIGTKKLEQIRPMLSTETDESED